VGKLMPPHRSDRIGPPLVFTHVESRNHRILAQSTAENKQPDFSRPDEYRFPRMTADGCCWAREIF
jgi:hypothetical protein